VALHSEISCTCWPHLVITSQPLQCVSPLVLLVYSHTKMHFPSHHSVQWQTPLTDHAEKWTCTVYLSSNFSKVLHKEHRLQKYQAHFCSLVPHKCLHEASIKSVNTDGVSLLVSLSTAAVRLRTGWCKLCDKAPMLRDTMTVKRQRNPWTGPQGSRRLRLPDFITLATGRWSSCQLYAPTTFTPSKFSWYSFLLDAELNPWP